MLHTYRTISQTLSLLLPFCEGEELSEIRFEIARAKWVCKAGTKYYRQRDVRMADYEQLSCHYALIEKLAWYKMGDRRVMKLLRELKKGVEGLVDGAASVSESKNSQL